MYGWHGRIGVILPADNGVLEPDFHRLAPEGVATHVARLRKVPRSEMPVLALQEAETLAHTRVHLIAYMCAASSFVLGPARNRTLCQELTKASGGLPSLTATTAMVDALNAVGARRVSVLSPHPPEVAQSLKQYLDQSGFTVTDLDALGLDLAAINDTKPEEILAIIRRKNLRDADSIFIAATNFRAIDIIDTVEAETGLPVVTSNQAALWAALEMLKYRGQRPGFGRLLKAAAR